MIYMVEMNLIDKDRREDWDNWYEAHTNMLLTFPGFHATQRFECMTDAKAPFVALHHVDGPEFFKSDAYTNKAGPRGTGEWRTKMNNWSRNLFQGLETTPNISFNEYLCRQKICHICHTYILVWCSISIYLSSFADI